MNINPARTPPIGRVRLDGGCCFADGMKGPMDSHWDSGWTDLHGSSRCWLFVSFSLDVPRVLGVSIIRWLLCCWVLDGCSLGVRSLFGWAFVVHSKRCHSMYDVDFGCSTDTRCMSLNVACSIDVRGMIGGCRFRWLLDASQLGGRRKFIGCSLEVQWL